LVTDSWRLHKFELGSIAEAILTDKHLDEGDEYTRRCKV